jgi:hypothetical protein
MFLPRSMKIRAIRPMKVRCFDFTHPSFCAILCLNIQFLMQYVVPLFYCFLSSFNSGGLLDNVVYDQDSVDDQDPVDAPLKRNVMIVVQRGPGVQRGRGADLFQTQISYSLVELESMRICDLIEKISRSERDELGQIDESSVMFSVGAGAKQTILGGSLLAEKAASSFYRKDQHKWYLKTTAATSKSDQQGKIKPPAASKSHVVGATRASGNNKLAFHTSPLVRFLPLFPFLSRILIACFFARFYMFLLGILLLFLIVVVVVVVLVVVVSPFPFLNQDMALASPHGPSENTPADLDEEADAVTQYDVERELARRAIRGNVKFTGLTPTQIDQWATMYALNRDHVSLTNPPREVTSMSVNNSPFFCFYRCSYDTKVMLCDSLFV